MSTVFATVSTPGPPGAAGPPGYSPKFIVASGPPGAGTGNNGDMYIDSSNGNVYGPKTAGAWGAIVANIKGPTGPTGATGYSPQYIVATGAPAAGTGNNGDMYIDSSTSNVYGPKTAGAWGAVACNIKGSPGTAGAQGPPGVAYTPRGAWSAATTYAQGDEVTDVSVLYIALQGSNLNHVPASSPTWWQPVGTGGSAQTPWLSNIDGGGFTLQHVAAINVGNTVTPVAPVHVVGSFSGAAFPGIVVANSSPTVGSSVAVAFAVGNTGSTVTGAISNLAESATAAAIVFSTYNSGLLERMRITAAGNVGIGIVNPLFPLTILATATTATLANTTVRINRNVGSSFAGISISGVLAATPCFYSPISTDDWAFGFDAGSGIVERMRITSAGNVGIGTGATTPKALLDVNLPNLTAQAQAIRWGSNATGVDLGYLTNDPVSYYSGAIALYFNGSPSTFISAKGNSYLMGGNVGIGYASPNFPLSFGPSIAARKIALYDGGPSTFWGFGMDSSSSRYEAGGGGGHNFYCNGGTFAMTVYGNGLVGIAKAVPVYALDVVGDVNCTGSFRVNGTAIGSGGSGITAKSIVTGSRVAGTSYQNSTGKSMFVTIVGNVVATGYMQLWTDAGNPPSAVACAVTNVAPGTAAVFSVSAWVLAGHFYQLSTPGATIQSWVEWT